MLTTTAPAPHPGHVAGGHAKKGVKNNMLSRGDAFRLGDWLRVKGRLDGPTNSILLAEAASKELHLTITSSNVLSLLKDLGLEIKHRSRRAPSEHTTRSEYLASCLISVIEHTGGTVPDELLKVALGDKAVTFANAPLPSWAE